MCCWRVQTDREGTCAPQVFGEPGTMLQGVLESIGQLQLQVGQGVVQVHM